MSGGSVEPGVALAPPEVLTAGDIDRSPRRWPRWVAAGCVVLAVAGWALDRHQRGVELMALRTSVEHGQRVAQSADAHVAGMTQYGASLRDVPSAPTSVRTYLTGLVQTAASEGASVVQDESVRVAELRVLPWHAQARDAQIEYADYLAARTAVLTAEANGDDAGPAARAVNGARSRAQAALDYAFADEQPSPQLQP